MLPARSGRCVTFLPSMSRDRMQIWRTAIRLRSGSSGFSARWIRSLFTMAVDSLRAECSAAGEGMQFSVFRRADLSPVEAENGRASTTCGRVSTPGNAGDQLPRLCAPGVSALGLERLAGIVRQRREFQSRPGAVQPDRPAMTRISDSALEHLREVAEVAGVGRQPVRDRRCAGTGGMGTVSPVPAIRSWSGKWRSGSFVPRLDSSARHCDSGVRPAFSRSWSIRASCRFMMWVGCRTDGSTT